MSRPACVASLVALALTVLPAGLSGQTASNLDAVIARCITGGRPAIQQAFPTEQAFRAVRGDLFQKTRDWRQAWTPTGPTFLLELAAWGLEQSWVDSVVVLRTAGDLVIRRSGATGGTAIGVDAAQDEYEIAFHRSAVALLTSSRLFDEAERYLDMVRERIVAAPAPQTRLVDPRLPLTRAVLLDARTAPGFIAEGSLGVGLDGRPSGALKDAMERADAAYVVASSASDLTAEAMIRRAFVQHRLGRHAEAVSLLTQTLDTRDPTLAYWQQLFLGRSLDALGRQTDAAAAYERADALYPGAQTPSVALASLYQRQGELNKAAQWAARARAVGVVPEDPWWQYFAGELRFYSTWLATLREARP